MVLRVNDSLTYYFTTILLFYCLTYYFNFTIRGKKWEIKCDEKFSFISNQANSHLIAQFFNLLVKSQFFTFNLKIKFSIGKINKY